MYDMITKIVAKVKTLPEAVTAFKESIVNAIGDAVTGLASEEYVNTAVTGLASEEYVGTAIATAKSAVDLGAQATLTGLQTAIQNAMTDIEVGVIVPATFSASSTFDKFVYTGTYVGILQKCSTGRVCAMFSNVGNNTGSRISILCGVGSDSITTATVPSRESIGIYSTTPIEVGESVAIDAEAVVNLPTGYTYTNTRVLSCYLFVNNTQYGEGYVHWYISSDNKLHAINKSGSVGSIQAFIARLL